jgi:Zn-dependent M28 family amino/carboxypeptidase
MDAARPRRRRPRPRRGTVDRPLNARLVRASALIVAPAALALLFSISTTGTLPPPSLEPVFDGAAAGELASRLTAEYPSRIPGTPEAGEAAGWFGETISAFGFTVENDVWSEDVPDLGHVELTNVVAVVPGQSERSIVVVAHRDNRGTALAYGDNASGTAALIELARGFAPRGATIAPRPSRTLVLVSTDGGAYGGAGAARFAGQSRFAEGAFAAVVLDGIAGRGRPRIAIAGDEPRSPAPAFLRTAAARVREQVGIEPSLASVPTQLVDLGIPFAAGEQGPFLGAGVAALTLTTDEAGDPPIPFGDRGTVVSIERLEALGRATESLVGSIDTSLGAAFRTPDTIFLGDRAASGWAVRVTLIVAVVPFALGVLDLVVRSRRRTLPLRPAARALRARLLFWLYAGVLLWLAGVTGILPTGAPLPVPPYSDFVTDWPVAGAALLGLALGFGWTLARRRLVETRGTTPEERLAGYTVALAWLGALSIVIGLLRPYALVFVLPSLYAWLWLPLRTRFWTRAALFGVGLLGPLAGFLIVASQVGLGVLDTAVYLSGLVTIGYVPWTTVLLGLAWITAAAQLGALALGRYSPYAGGREPPPPGPVRAGAYAIAGAVRGRYASSR